MIFRFFCSRQLDQLFRLGHIAGEWLLDKNVLAIFERSFGQFVMRPYRRHHRNCVDFGRSDEFQSVRSHINARKVPVNSLAGYGALVTHGCDFGAGYALQVPHDVRAPIAIPYDAKPDRADCFSAYLVQVHRGINIYCAVWIGRHLMTPPPLTEPLQLRHAECASESSDPATATRFWHKSHRDAPCRQI